MKKYMFLAFLGVAVASASPLIAKADEPVDVASTTPEVVNVVVPNVGLPMFTGGYSQVCSYILVYKDTCDSSKYSQVKFALDESYREAILIPWREVIFHGKYNHQND